MHPYYNICILDQKLFGQKVRSILNREIGKSRILQYELNVRVYYYILWFVFMWSFAMCSLNGTTLLYKIVLSVNLQKIHHINIKCIVYNKNKNNLCVQCACGVYLHCFGTWYLTRPPNSSDIPMQKQWMNPQTQVTDWTHVCSCYKTILGK